MAKRQKDKRSQEVAEDEPGAPTSSSEENADAALAVIGGEGAAIEAASSAGDSEESGAGAPGDEAAEGEGADSDDLAAGQLGSARYVLAGFFAAGLLGGYVLSRVFEGIWGALANKDWFSNTFPSLAAVPDESKDTYSTVLGAVIALVTVLRAYRRPDVRTWTDEVASELAKVKWPSRKEVSSSTVIVIAASAIATVYLALLDRFWAFVTNLVYGNGT